MNSSIQLNSSDVFVAVPVYKANPDDNEKKAFLQCLMVLHRYDIVIVHPQGLDLSAHRELSCKEFQSVAFPDKYFRSVKGYNRLLLHPGFYQAFAQYQYMLIHQLDAWVFSDTLLEWCRKGYDYIGAPWLAEPLRGRTSAWIPFTKLCLNRVGNGGLSLRKVSTHLNLSKRLRPLTFLYFYNEDVFWSLIVPLFITSYCKPSVEEALGFAFESRPSECYSRIGGKLPFGCHAWEKNEPDFWKQYIRLDDNNEDARRCLREPSESRKIV